MASSLARFVMILTTASMLLFSFGAMAAVPVYTGTITLHDPHSMDAVFAALSWLGDALLGSLVTAIAITAAAATCAMMLTGRATWRLGAAVILGFGLLWGSAALAPYMPPAATMAR